MGKIRHETKNLIFMAGTSEGASWAQQERPDSESGIPVTDLCVILEENMGRILDFFGLKELREKVTVKMYDSVEEYERHVTEFFGEYFDWMIADTFDGNINLLSYDRCRSTSSHRNMRREDYVKVIVHEFVHICQQCVNDDATGCEWFWEALATNLSGQTYNETALSCTGEQLQNAYSSMADGYAISYTLGKWMLARLPHQKILDYVKEPGTLRRDTEEILRSAVGEYWPEI